ncbi:MAG: hemerythrin family protein, partial [Magnetospirillum sp.]|nr:hemerythrin family protein [Magnetospirillum sp.]
AHTAILERVDTALAQLDEVLSVPERHRRLDELETMLVEHEMLEDAAFWDTLRAHAGQPVLQWTALMTTGINWLDDQHREMVAQLNGLAKAAQDGRHEEAGQRLRRFLDMARAHFADEERQLAEWGEAMPEHRAEHARMLEELDSLVNDGDDPGILVNHYLRFWMIDHILGLDRRDLAGRS